MGAGAVVLLSTIQSDEGDRTLEVVEERLVRFTFIDTDKKADIAELEFWDGDMALLDDPVFRVGQKLLVCWGWSGNMSPPRRMIVQRTKDSNIIKLKDEAALLDKKRHHRVWHNMRDSDVVEQVAKEWGYDGILADIVPTHVIRPAISQRTTDARFVQQLARRNACVWYVDAAGFHFHPRRTAIEPTRAFYYKNDPGQGDVLTRPQIEGNVLDVSKVRVEARDPLTKEMFTVEVGVDTTEDDATLGGYLSDFVAMGDEEEIGDPDSPNGAREARSARTATVSMGYATREEAEQEAAARYIETAQSRYGMRVTVRGDPRVGAKQLHWWNMPSEAYSGLYYCYEARTTITPGSYRIDLSYKKDALKKIATKAMRPVGRKKNKKEPELDENGQPKNKEDFEEFTTVKEENGQLVFATQFKEPGKGGENVGDARALTADELRAKDPAELDSLAQKFSGGVVLPGE